MNNPTCNLSIDTATNRTVLTIIFDNTDDNSNDNITLDSNINVQPKIVLNDLDINRVQIYFPSPSETLLEINVGTVDGNIDHYISQRFDCISYTNSIIADIENNNIKYGN